MQRKIIAFLFFIIFAISGYASSTTQSVNMKINTTQIEQLTGTKGQLDAKENVFKVSVPRNDLSVTVAGVKMVPAMGLTSWAAFKAMGQDTMVMGDMVMTEDQVNSVMDVALNNGFNVTALHNHFFWDQPKIMFMHIEGKGDEAKLASAAGKVFEKIKETSGGKGKIPVVDIDPTKTTLHPQIIDAILGVKGVLTNGVYKVVIGRETKMHSHTIGNAMGVNTWAAFAGSDDRAVVDGDFAMQESELQKVLKALRDANIDIVAIHQHMTGEEPRIMFLHYWGVGSTKKLATGLRSALNQTKS